MPDARISKESWKFLKKYALNLGEYVSSHSSDVALYISLVLRTVSRKNLITLVYKGDFIENALSRKKMLPFHFSRISFYQSKQRIIKQNVLMPLKDGHYIFNALGIAQAVAQSVRSASERTRWFPKDFIEEADLVCADVSKYFFYWHYPIKEIQWDCIPGQLASERPIKRRKSKKIIKFPERTNET